MAKFTVCYRFFGAVDVEADTEEQAVDKVCDMDDNDLLCNAEFEPTSVLQYDEQNGKTIWEHIL